MSSEIHTFYRDHWVDVSDERHERYEQILAWSDQLEPLFAPAGVGPGHTVLDFGTGPGNLAIEMARRVGPDGHVHAVDINPDFLARAASKAEAEGLADRFSVHLLDDHRLPVDDGSVDRVLAKNVLEYVPDVDAVLAECFRITVPGGRMTATDSDWDFLILDPWTPDEQRRFFAAGAHAFNEPNIGRKLRGLMLDAGFVDVEVSIHTRIDTTGRMLGVVQNFVGYIADFDTMPAAEVAHMVERLEHAVDTGRFFGVSPQFSVTGHRP